MCVKLCIHLARALVDLSRHGDVKSRFVYKHLLSKNLISMFSVCDSCYGVLRNTLYFNDTYIYILNLVTLQCFVSL